VLLESAFFVSDDRLLPANKVAPASMSIANVPKMTFFMFLILNMTLEIDYFRVSVSFGNRYPSLNQTPSGGRQQSHE
jgi:hypothetical protein